VVSGAGAPAVADRAVGLGMAIADALDYVGVLAVEFFVVGGDVIVNELAPRPHNSGHWTLDAARTSQFEQQVRAVCGLGLGDTALAVPAVAMVNLLGDLWAGGRARLGGGARPSAAKLHLYGKEPRPGRKMGHLTVLADSRAEAETEPPPPSRPHRPPLTNAVAQSPSRLQIRSPVNRCAADVLDDAVRSMMR
jgi:5-(carboxyamino)imidazole ribonucleotide synthase